MAIDKAAITTCDFIASCDAGSRGGGRSEKFWVHIYVNPTPFSSSDYGLSFGLNFHSSILVPLWFISLWFTDHVLTFIKVPFGLSVHSS